MHANIFKRFFAYIVDYILVALLQFTLMYIFSIKDQKIALVIFIFLYVIYYLVEGVILEGQSPGKKLFKIKIISVNSNELNNSQKILRVVYYILVPLVVMSVLSFFASNLPSMYIYMISYIIYALFAMYPFLLLFHPQNRSLVDIFTNTAIIDLNKSKNDFKWVELNSKSLIGSAIIVIPLFLLIFIQFKMYKQFELLEKSAHLSKAVFNVSKVNTIINIMPNENEEYSLVVIIQIKADELEKHKSEKFKYIDTILNSGEKLVFSDIKIIYTSNDLNLKPVAEDEHVINRYLMQKQCEKGIGISCYHFGNYLKQHENNPDEAFVYLDKACQMNLSVACANAGYILYSLNKSPEKQKYYAERACELGDYLGCSNLACDYCRSNKKEAAIKSFEKSFEILKQNKEYELEVLKYNITDSELDCVKDAPVWSEYLKFVNNLQKK